MAYIVIINWDEQDAVPFGTIHESKLFYNKETTWRYVKRVQQRAEIAHVQLHNISVHKCRSRNAYSCGESQRLWSLRPITFW